MRRPARLLRWWRRRRLTGARRCALERARHARFGTEIRWRSEARVEAASGVLVRVAVLVVMRAVRVVAVAARGARGFEFSEVLAGAEVQACAVALKTLHGV